MRVSNKMLYNSVMGNMQRNLEKLLDLQESASSGKKINKPSDDPIGATKVINNYTGTASPDGYIDVEIDAGDTISINMPGYAVFGSATDGTDILAALDDLKTAMESNDSDGIETAMTNIDAGMDQAIDALAEVGARINRLEIASNHFDKLLMDLAVYKSETEDADITRVITELSIQQNMLEVSRATAAKVLQQSIMDFLR